jgi:hypothetical protein
LRRSSGGTRKRRARISRAAPLKRETAAEQRAGARRRTGSLTVSTPNPNSRIWLIRKHKTTSGRSAKGRAGRLAAAPGILAAENRTRSSSCSAQRPRRPARAGARQIRQARRLGDTETPAPTCARGRCRGAKTGDKPVDAIVAGRGRQRAVIAGESARSRTASANS